MATTTLLDLAGAARANPTLLSDFDLARLEGILTNRTQAEEIEFIRSVGDEDRPILQVARTIVLCERHLVPGLVGSVIGVNSASRRNADVVFNPDQDDDGISTEVSSFLFERAPLDPISVWRMLVDCSRDFRFLKVYITESTVVYLSMRPFSVKNLLLDDHVPSVEFGGFHAAAL